MWARRTKLDSKKVMEGVVAEENEYEDEKADAFGGKISALLDSDAEDEDKPNKREAAGREKAKFNAQYNVVTKLMEQRAAKKRAGESLDFPDAKRMRD